MRRRTGLASIQASHSMSLSLSSLRRRQKAKQPQNDPPIIGGKLEGTKLSNSRSKATKTFFDDVVKRRRFMVVVFEELRLEWKKRSRSWRISQLEWKRLMDCYRFATLTVSEGGPIRARSNGWNYIWESCPLLLSAAGFKLCGSPEERERESCAKVVNALTVINPK